MQLRNKTMWMVVLALIVVAGLGSLMGRAATSNDIAFVDVAKIGDTYIHPLIQEPLQQELKKLQTEFDAKAKDLSDDAKGKMFETYQTKLDAREQELINVQLLKIRTIAQQIAKDSGYKVVLDREAVVTGGVDITSQVLAKLKSSK